MTLLRYIQDKMIIIALNMIFDFLLGLLLLLYGCDIYFVMIIWLFRIIMMGVYLCFGYFRLRGLTQRCEKTMKSIEKVYLISDILPKPETSEEMIYFELLRAACKSMNDEVFRCRQGQSVYKDYIEAWIHKVKNPVAAIKLICSNNRTKATSTICTELEEIEYLLEQVLYYARSETMERDYFIRGFKLSDVINDALLQYRTLLLRLGFKIDITDSDELVYSDEKWVSFILRQIISNSIKYCYHTKPCLLFVINKADKYINLSVKDNGSGISQADIPRIFERGFTGINRRKSGATGMGLYICKNLCDKMGLTISAESELGKETRIEIKFPYGQFTKL
jgi:signal transduction histidine kinase